MNKFYRFFIPSFAFIVLAASYADAGNYLETYNFTQKSDYNSCALDLNLNNGAYEKIKLELKYGGNKSLTDEEIARGISKVWPEEVSWEKRFDGTTLLWKEELVDGISRKTSQKTIKVKDKLKAFFTKGSSNIDNTNFRAIFDVYAKIVPIDNGKAADVYFVAVRNSTKSAKNLFKDKFSDQTKIQALREDKTHCFQSDTKPQGDSDVSGEIWGVKTLSK